MALLEWHRLDMLQMSTTGALKGGSTKALGGQGGETIKGHGGHPTHLQVASSAVSLKSMTQEAYLWHSLDRGGHP